MEACAAASRAARPQGEAFRRAGHRAGLLLAALGAAALAAAPAASARGAADPSLDVVFSANGTITVVLADGPPVGSASGAPTLIPAGYYTVLLSGPGGCVMLPTFDLSGPGVSIVNNLDDGEVNSTGLQTELEPDSTYTWSDNAAPGVVYSFTTSRRVERLKLATVLADKSPVAGDTAISIECLACGTVRAVAGSRIEDTGECGAAAMSAGPSPTSATGGPSRAW